MAAAVSSVAPVSVVDWQGPLHHLHAVDPRRPRQPRAWADRLGETYGTPCVSSMSRQTLREMESSV